MGGKNLLAKRKVEDLAKAGTEALWYLKVTYGSL